MYMGEKVLERIVRDYLHKFGVGKAFLCVTEFSKTMKKKLDISGYF